MSEGSEREREGEAEMKDKREKTKVSTSSNWSRSDIRRIRLMSTFCGTTENVALLVLSQHSGNVAFKI